MRILKKLFLLFLIIAAAYWITAQSAFQHDTKTEFGVSFSSKYSEQLGLEWKEAYAAILDDLGAKKLRLASYWDDIEKEQDMYNFEDLDWMVAQAAERDAEIILSLGERQPRWPECHTPDWAQKLTKDAKNIEIHEFIRETVNRYKDSPAVIMWQVENEPFLRVFGECPDPITQEELEKEISLVRELDNSRNILVTDSGELSLWYPAITYGDVFGTTLYRTTWNKYLGYWDYFFIGPSWYRVRAALYKRTPENIIISELQAEPWFPDIAPVDAPLEEHFKSMTPERLNKIISFTEKTNFGEAYLWGVEWWYWLKEVHGDDKFWEIGKNLLNT